MASHQPASRYLEGAFAPVRAEHTAYDLPVQGRLPEDLDGLFTQIGPSPAGPPRLGLDGSYPWFMQDGLVCGVRLRKGRAEWFRNRWLRSRRAARRLAESPAPGPRHLPVDTVNTNLVAHHGLVLALVESGCLPAQLSATLETVRYTDFAGQLPRGFSAHPKIDPVTGEMHVVAYSPLRTWAEYIVVSRAGRVVRNQRIELGGRPLLHDIALTPSYVLFFDLPVRLSLPDAAARRFPYRWRDGRPARIGVLSRADGSVRWVAIDPCFVYHIVNAEESGSGRLTLRALRYARLFDDRAADPLGRPATLWTWSIDLARDYAPAREVDDQPQEMPRSDPRRQGVQHRFYYATAYEPNGGRNGVRKFDLVSGVGETRQYPAGQVLSESVFVPRAATADEDGGWLVHFRYDSDRDASDVVVLDAQDITGPAVAVIRLPVRVPVGAHSAWIDASELGEAPAA
jgi:carotenoid cleavage dioxygenase-like enzyme